MRRRFVRRVFMLLVVLLVLVAAGGALWAAFGPRYPWWQGQHPGAGPQSFPWFLLPGTIFLVMAVVVIVRVLRRTAAPIGEVMEAAGRLAAGDYSVRVDPRGSGDVRRLINSFNDMASRLQVNEQQRRALLAEIAHELRTPLSVMHGDVEGMLDGVYPRDDERLQSILAATDRTTRLLEDLQLLSTAQAGALRLYKEPIDVAAVLESTRAAFAPLAAERGVTLTARADEAPQVDADPVRLRQVLDNLVGNSLRFTPSGGAIAIVAGTDGRSAVFSVRDDGEGIPVSQLPHLFERFSESGDAKGSGLGLAIAKALVEGHGGTISADSTPGNGTTIAFALPLPGPR
jgi:signal transduction histidine kinase